MADTRNHAPWCNSVHGGPCPPYPPGDSAPASLIERAERVALRALVLKEAELLGWDQEPFEFSPDWPNLEALLAERMELWREEVAAAVAALADAGLLAPAPTKEEESK